MDDRERTVHPDEQDTGSAHRPHGVGGQDRPGAPGSQPGHGGPGGGSTAAQRLGGPSDFEQAFAGDGRGVSGEGRSSAGAGDAGRVESGGESGRPDAASGRAEGNAEPAAATAGDAPTAGTSTGSEPTVPGSTGSAGTGPGAAGSAVGSGGAGGAAKVVGAGAGGTSSGTLIPPDRAESYRARWTEIKGEFVDEPRRAVRGANELVGEVLDELESLFRKQRSDIEQGLDSDDTTTEDLRLAIGKYRTFFDRLLSL